MVNSIRSLISILLVAGPLWAQASAADLEMMERARALYARGDLAGATDLYTKIPASSDFWLDALEERAWAATRQGDHEKALADLQSITSSVWSAQVGPETYMLSTFVSLKICAWKDVVKKINIFKKRMLPRVDSLELIVEGQMPAGFWNFKDSLKKGQISMASLGKNAELYPRYFYRDRQLLDAVHKNQMSRADARMKELAKQDLKEIEINLKKMKIIEVELIQHVLMADDLAKKKGQKLDFASVDRNKQIVFPVSDDEVWVDEVGKYQVKAENCPYNKRGSL